MITYRSAALMAAACSVLMLAAGCARNEAEDASPERKAINEKIESAKTDVAAARERLSKESGEAATALKDYAIEKREEIAERMRALMKDSETELAALRERMTTMTGEARVQAEKAAEQLAAVRDQAAVKLDELSSATAEAWGDLSTGLSTAVDDLTSAVKEAKRLF